MALTDDQIKALLAKPEQKPRGKAKGIDTSVRDIKTWFALAKKMFDEDTQDLVMCANPNCNDPRPGRGTVAAKVNGEYMCRFCFLEGWLSVDAQQIKLGES